MNSRDYRDALERYRQKVEDYATRVEGMARASEATFKVLECEAKAKARGLIQPLEDLATVKGVIRELEYYKNLVANRDATIERLLADRHGQQKILKQFADMISPAVTQMPLTTKYQPKMTLAPFIDAYRAVYGDLDIDEA